LDAQRVRWTEEARIREKVEQHRRHIQIFRTNLLAEAAAARDGELLTQYVLANVNSKSGLACDALCSTI
jgi:hypothetical protein